MSFFDLFKKKATSRPPSPTPVLYPFLFCDDLELYRQSNSSPETYPWDVLFSSTFDLAGLETIVQDPEMESRVKILAFNKMIANGHQPAQKELLGIIVEVGLMEGLDVLASYSDGRARYINYSGKTIIWEAVTPESALLTGQLFRDGNTIMEVTGPWDEPRRPQPAQGMARITLLVSDGLYFGEGPMNAFFKDPLAAPALTSAAELMKFLIEQAENKEKAGRQIIGPEDGQ